MKRCLRYCGKIYDSVADLPQSAIQKGLLDTSNVKVLEMPTLEDVESVIFVAKKEFLDMIAWIAKYNKITAIKLFRRVMCWSLRESKDAVEELLLD